MAESTTNTYDIYKLSSRVNYTDPIVRHDPSAGFSVVAKFQSTTDPEKNPEGAQENDYDNKKTDGVQIPIIRINNTVIEYPKIARLNINYDDFLPSLSLMIEQNANEIDIYDSPGMSNSITVIMLPKVDGAYKKISLEFYIDKIVNQGKYMMYHASYKMIELEKAHTEQITFNPFPNIGCTAKYCQLGPNRYPSTYEFFHVLAEKIGLGFAATDQVKEISDNKTRLITNQNYKEVFQQHLKFSGLDENSIFDAWIDLYKYLVIVNMSWIFNENVQIEDIGAYVETSSPYGFEGHGLQQDSKMAQRVLTNYKEQAFNSSVQIKSYKWITYNGDIRINGTTNNYMIGGPIGYNDDNNGAINQKDIEIIENSKEGEEYKDDYEFTKSSFLGFEMGNADDNNCPVLYQEQIRNNYLRKKRAKRLRVEMNTPNMSLQRGILVWLMIMEYNEESKRKMIGYENLKDPEINRQLNMNTNPIPNLSLCGMWYIDGMEFEYTKHNKQITQFLYLIKKEQFNSPVSKANPEEDKMN